MGVPMPAVVVLIVCKVAYGAPDPNQDFTKHYNMSWAYEHSMMQCNREVIALEDSAFHSATAKNQAATRPFTINDCQRAGIMEGAKFNAKNKHYQWWRTACPTPIKNYGRDGIKGTADDETVDWVIPDCGHRDTVVCEKDSAI